MFVTRRRGDPVCINIAREEDIPTPMELESIQRGLEDIHNSRTYEMRQDETLDEFLNRVEPCIE